MAEKTEKQVRGNAAEDQALAFLQEQGLALLVRNFRCKLGEIDLVMQEQLQLVFVEVRARKNASFGGAAASITRNKQQKVIAAAHYFLQSQPRYRHSICRFDVIALDDNKPLEWIKNAFQLN